MPIKRNGQIISSPDQDLPDYAREDLPSWKLSGGGGGGAPTLYQHEDIADATAPTHTLSRPLYGVPLVHNNGIKLTVDVDYSLAANVITWTDPPIATDLLTVSFWSLNQ